MIEPDLVEELDRLLAELPRLRAENAKLREALCDATVHLVGAASAYRTYARRYGSLKPLAQVDAMFNTRADDFDKAVGRARAALK